MKKVILKVVNLKAKVGEKEILRGATFSVFAGEVAGLTGPNGSGKSSLALTLMGHPRYQVTGGIAKYLGKDLLALKPEERARAGLFLSFQYPSEITGVPFGKFLFAAYKEIHGAKTIAKDFIKILREKCALLDIDQTFVERSVNEGFSGGEKKRAEILQLAVLAPKLAILDETDSGLDVKARQTVAAGIKKIREENPQMSVLLITHYEDFLAGFNPQRTLKMEKGKIVE